MEEEAVDASDSVLPSPREVKSADVRTHFYSTVT